MTLHVTYRFPKGPSAQSIRAKLLNACKWTNDEQIRLINNYLWTWKHRSEIQITNKYGYKGGDAYAEIYIDDAHRGAFWYVEEGTKKRYAIMTRDFIAKTAPRRIQSGHGQGKLARVLKKQKGAKFKKGIEGRHVRREINKVVKKGFVTKIKQIIGEINFLGASRV